MTEDFSNPDLPGKVVALSERTILDGEWKKISITAQAPIDTEFATLSIFDTSGADVEIHINDVKFLSH